MSPFVKPAFGVQPCASLKSRTQTTVKPQSGLSNSSTVHQQSHASGFKYRDETQKGARLLHQPARLLTLRRTRSNDSHEPPYKLSGPR